ncbi:MAG: hypothetical protein ACKOBF_06045, partial [Limnohabitans sp.]
MKKLLPLMLAAVMALGSLNAEAARRMGGGKSVGQQSNNVTQREAVRPQAPAAPAQQTAPAAATKPTAAPAPAAATEHGAPGLLAGGSRRCRSGSGLGGRSRGSRLRGGRWRLRRHRRAL